MVSTLNKAKTVSAGEFVDKIGKYPEHDKTVGAGDFGVALSIWTLNKAKTASAGELRGKIQNWEVQYPE